MKLLKLTPEVAEVLLRGKQEFTRDVFKTCDSLLSSPIEFNPRTILLDDAGIVKRGYPILLAVQISKLTIPIIVKDDFPNVGQIHQPAAYFNALQLYEAIVEVSGSNKINDVLNTFFPEWSEITVKVPAKLVHAFEEHVKAFAELHGVDSEKVNQLL